MNVANQHCKKFVKDFFFVHKIKNSLNKLALKQNDL